MPPSQQLFDWLKTKRSLIASDVLKLVKTYFKDARFIDQSEEVMRHVWWALLPDGLGYHAKPAPIGVKDIRSIDYIVSDRHSLDCNRIAASGVKTLQGLEILNEYSVL
jgi:hypothetical protein